MNRSKHSIWMILAIICLSVISVLLFKMTWRAEDRTAGNKDAAQTQPSGTEQKNTGNNNEPSETGSSDNDTRIREIDEILQDPYMVLVNADHGLGENDKPDELVTVRGMSMEKTAAEHMKKMLSDAEAAGHGDLNIYSAYRSYAKQSANFSNKISQYKAKGYSDERAEELAAKIVNPPGKSEHQTGMAADICTSEMVNKYGSLPEEFSETETYEWLYKHCSDYGFILRYPEDKAEITGITFEPWHYRYVGEKYAKEIMSRKICLEEYIEGLEKEKAELQK